MKFSYSRLKQLVPAVISPEDAAHKLTMGLFEVESIDDDTLDVKVLPNRYSDAASHLGLAREISAFGGKKFTEPKLKLIKPRAKQKISVVVKDKTLCQRMIAWYFEGINIGPSPKWMQDILRACGMRPINNLVDITNFVMVETGQPLHVFDFNRMDSPELIVRRAFPQEKVTTLDNREFVLDPEVLVLADQKDALDVAGIKGGKKAEVSEATTRILLIADTFLGTNIYKTQRKLNLMTDAGLRFTHNLSPELAMQGALCAGELIVDICKGMPGQMKDVYGHKVIKHPIKIKLDDQRINQLLGTRVSFKEMVEILTRIGFAVKGRVASVPVLRTDISTIEDIAEEVGRLYGYNRIESVPLQASVTPVNDLSTEKVRFREKIKNALSTLGYDEVYNYSFINESDAKQNSLWKGKAPALENPISEEQTHLRHSLVFHILRNLHENHKHRDEVHIFEIGNTFHEYKNKPGEAIEVPRLGIAALEKENKNTFFKIKGAVEELLRELLISGVRMREEKTPPLPLFERGLWIESGGQKIGFIGYTKNGLSIAELDLEQVQKRMSAHHMFVTLPKFPRVVRDISYLMSVSVKVGELIETVQSIGDYHIVRDVEFLNEYQDKNWHDKKSIALRIIFEHKDRTLEGKEVDEEIEKITKILKEKFEAEIR